MKIVQVIENFLPDSVGGTETYVLNISRIFMDSGHEVHVVAPSVNGDREYLFEGIKVHRYSIDKIAKKDEYKQIVAPKGLNQFIDIIKTIEPDVVHFNTFNRSVNIYHLKSVKQLGIKTFLTPHISGIFCAKGSLIDYCGQRCDGIVSKHDCVKCYLKSNGYGNRTILISRLAEKMLHLHHSFDKMIPSPAFLKQNRLDEYNDLNKWADGVIALSPWIENALRGNGVNNVILVRQGISESLMHSSDSNLDPLGRLKIIYVGRVYQIKNLETLCDALETIDNEKVELTMACICNDDEYSRNIKRRLMKLPHVNWYENVPQNKLGKIIRQNDFLILTSFSEMSPLVILESFANNVPVIATDIPPISDNVENTKNGILFPVGDSLQLSQILVDLINNPNAKTAMKSGVKPPRTFKDVASELLQIYNS